LDDDIDADFGDEGANDSEKPSVHATDRESDAEEEGAAKEFVGFNNESEDGFVSDKTFLFTTFVVQSFDDRSSSLIANEWTLARMGGFVLIVLAIASNSLSLLDRCKLAGTTNDKDMATG